MTFAIRVAGLLAGSVLLAAPALAADVLPVAIPAAAAPAPIVTSLAGYVEVFGGYRGLRATDEDADGALLGGDRGPMFGGTGQVAYDVTPSFGIQVGAWSRVLQRKEFDADLALTGDELTSVFGALAAHLVFDAGNLQFGAMASVMGLASYGGVANLAGEIAAGFGDLRLVGQAGWLIGVSSVPADTGLRRPYVRAAATYYLSPDFSVSVNAGWDRFSLETNPLVVTTLTSGARIEHRLGDAPLSLLAVYQSQRGMGNDGILEVDRRVSLGMRFLLGVDSVQALDEAVPFADINPFFGDLGAAR